MPKILWRPLVALPLLAACYRYVPTSARDLGAATPVAVELSTRGTLNVANRLGDNVVRIEGMVTEANPTALTLSVRTVQRRGENAVSNWAGESLTLTPEDIGEVSRRELSRSRTTLSAVALGAASVGLVVGIAKATGTASGGTIGKPNPNP